MQVNIQADSLIVQQFYGQQLEKITVYSAKSDNRNFLKYF